VAWTIEPEDNPDLVPGMALRFGQIGKQSRAVIDELVDFHIATGGDPFDVGPRGAQPGEIPTDSLGGIGGGGSSTIDSPAPEPKSLSLPPDSERPDPVDDGVLPDWLSEPTGLPDQGNSVTYDSLGFAEGSDTSSPLSSSSDDFGFSSQPAGGEFEVDLVVDEGETEVAPRRPEEGSFQQMAMAPRAGHKPPRDLRLGLVVTAGIVLVAVVVLVWSVWLKDAPQEALQTLPQDETVSEAGVVLIEDDQEGSVGPPAGVNAPDGGNATETAAATAAETASEAVSDSNSVDSGRTTPSGSAGDGPLASKDTVSEIPPEEIAPPAAQPRASRVVDVVAAARGGSTSIVIRGNGAFDDSALRVSRLEEPLRLWVRVFNIETFYKPNEIDVGSSEVHRVRIGYHPEDNPPALYVVLDLAGDDVQLLDRSVQGDAIRLTVGRK
jgi:hypothetical protein